MTTLRHRSAVALTAAAALAIGVIPAAFTTSSILASGEGTTTLESATAPPPTFGWIALSTGDVDEVTIDANGNGIPEGDPQVLQEGSACKLATSGPSYLAFNGFVGSTDGKASFASDSIGVAEKKSGTSCYQVSAGSASTGEMLSVSLGSRMASSAYLDVELKQGARILASAKVGTDTVGYYELQSGGSIGAEPWTDGIDDALPYTVFTCNNPSDSGPDSGVNDNCRWPISAPSWLERAANETEASAGLTFDSLDLKALAGTFSLEGGSDGPVPGEPPAPRPQRASLFELTGLECAASTETVSASGAQPEITVRRLNNADPAETCVGIPYSLSHDLQSATFLKPATQNSAQFVMDMVWLQSAGDPPGTHPTKVNFRPGAESAGDRILGWCPDALFAANGTLTGVVAPLGGTVVDPTSGTIIYSALPDLDTEVDHTQYACIATQTAKVVSVAGRTLGASNDNVQVAEQIYVLGDIKTFR